MAQAVQGLLCKPEAPSSNFNTTQKNSCATFHRNNNKKKTILKFIQKCRRLNSKNNPEQKSMLEIS
jgi:hypothetical protein